MVGNFSEERFPHRLSPVQSLYKELRFSLDEEERPIDEVRLGAMDLERKILFSLEVFRDDFPESSAMQQAWFLL